MECRSCARCKKDKENLVLSGQTHTLTSGQMPLKSVDLHPVDEACDGVLLVDTCMHALCLPSI